MVWEALKGERNYRRVCGRCSDQRSHHAQIRLGCKEGRKMFGFPELYCPVKQPETSVCDVSVFLDRDCGLFPLLGRSLPGVNLSMTEMTASLSKSES